MSGVRMLHFLKTLMEIHLNPPILYYGFNLVLKVPNNDILKSGINAAAQIYKENHYLVFNQKEQWTK